MAPLSLALSDPLSPGQPTLPEVGSAAAATAASSGDASVLEAGKQAVIGYTLCTADGTATMRHFGCLHL